jgi:hypothetical protein
MSHHSKPRGLFLTAGGLGVVLVLSACGEGAPDASESAAADSAALIADADSLSIADVGLETPESALHDATADVYFVSNIAGGPSDKDNNGFISRISPQGEVIALRFISGGQGGVVLHAPKGMALKGDSLFVADLDSIRVFHRETGAPLGGRGVPGAGFLNDLAVGPDGLLYATDSGIQIGPQGMVATGADAVFRLGPGDAVEALISGTDLLNPNGLVVDETGVTVFPLGGSEVYHVDNAGARHSVAILPGGQLDGAVRLADGSLLVSGWEGSAIYRIASAGTVTTPLEGIESPADIGYDAGRGRVLIPVFNTNRLEIRVIR